MSCSWPAPRTWSDRRSSTRPDATTTSGGRVNLFRTLCALDAGGPAIVAPDVVRIECPAPDGIRGDDPLVSAALGSVLAVDDLDPAPALSFDAPGFLPLAKTTAVVFRALDACGHETQRGVAVAVEDTRPPEPVLRLKRARLDPQDGGLVAVGLRAEATDACDLAPALELLVHADEPASGRGQLDAGIDAKGRLFLRAERDDGGDGRVYLCIVRAHDDSRNVGSACAAVVVPEDDTPEALELVLDQARAALEQCQLTGAAPAGFVLLARAWLPDGESASTLWPR